MVFYDHDGTAAANIYSSITSTTSTLTAARVRSLTTEAVREKAAFDSITSARDHSITCNLISDIILDRGHVYLGRNQSG